MKIANTIVIDTDIIERGEIILPEVDEEQPIPQEEVAPRIEKAFEKLWDVIVHNDNIHTYEYVTKALVQVVGLDLETALKCTKVIDKQGACIVARTTFEHAELLQEQLIELELKTTIERV